MRKSMMISAISVPFIVGLVFGYKHSLNSNLDNGLASSKNSELYVMAPEGALPSDLIESFQVENSVNVVVKTYRSIDELRSLTETEAQLDVLLVSSVQVPQLAKNREIRPLNLGSLSNIENISNDFLDLPTDPGAQFSVPLLWGVKDSKNERAQLEADLQRILSSDPVFQQIFPAQVIPLSMFQARSPSSGQNLNYQKSALWVSSFVIPERVHKEDLAYEFINYFLEPEVALELSVLTMQSSTNRKIENSELNPSLKPSHLRRQKLAEILRPTVR